MDVCALLASLCDNSPNLFGESTFIDQDNPTRHTTLGTLSLSVYPPWAPLATLQTQTVSASESRTHAIVQATAGRECSVERRGVGWPSGQRDDKGHTEESDVREARPPTLELTETGNTGRRSQRFYTRETTVLHVSGGFEKLRAHWVLS